ncbi:MULTISPECIES: LysR substrate-binding domain-containing protein [Pseudomonas]|uniref:LysR substrate-binding domain-containing protein n=1 Tax=Pseudomonas TaxID=286 RepID=UPI000760E051|nr:MULTISPECIES: LysR substrate-binding domain-containing protein [Pseudomonas]MBA6104637.1 LysR family transcriptional regulator [Pseudomonas monteilii]
MIHFSLRQIEYFVAAAECRTTLSAAKRLNVSQPSISHAIAELEDLWKERLFVRLPGKGIELSSAGLRRYHQARQLLESALHLGSASTDDVIGTLSLGCFATLGARHMPAMVERFTKRYPGVRIAIFEGDTEELVEKVERGTLDLALIYDMNLARKVNLHSIGMQVPYVLMPENHPLATKVNLSIQDLSGEPYILLDLPHSREYFLSLFRTANVVPDVVMELRSVEMVRSLVAHGHGVSILVTRPAGDLSYDGRRILCRPLETGVAPQQVVIAASKELNPTRAASAFLKLMGEQFSGNSILDT